METVSGDAGRPRSRKALGCLAAALLGAGAILQPQLANAAHGGGGGGGFHGGGGGFHGGGFGGFHGGGFHGGFAGMHHGFGERHEGFRDRRGVFIGGLGLGIGYYGYPYGWDYSPDYGYYGYSQPYSSQNWYYCSDPAGYYPYVTQCNTGWQTVPAS